MLIPHVAVNVQKRLSPTGRQMPKGAPGPVVEQVDIVIVWVFRADLDVDVLCVVFQPIQAELLEELFELDVLKLFGLVMTVRQDALIPGKATIWETLASETWLPGRPEGSRHT